MRFTKMQGAGNDYVYVDCFRDPTPSNPVELSRAISDRHFGVGSDGLILICPSQVADARMRMFNADGSEAEMCGNGIRCVAKYLYDHEIVRKPVLRIETGRSPRPGPGDRRGSGATRARGHGRADPRIGPYSDYLAGKPAYQRVARSRQSNARSDLCLHGESPLCVFHGRTHGLACPWVGPAGRKPCQIPETNERRVCSSRRSGGGHRAGLGTRLGRNAGVWHGSLRDRSGGRADRAD